MLNLIPIIKISIKETERWQHHLQKQDLKHHHIRYLIDPQRHHRRVLRSMIILLLHLKATEEKELLRRDHWPLPRAMREINRLRVLSRVRGPSHRGRSADGLVLQSLADLVPGHPAVLLPGARSLNLGDERSQKLPLTVDHVLRAVPGAARSAKVVQDLEIDLTLKEGGNLKA